MLECREKIMAEKIVVFAFNGDPICFVHVMLNALDMQEKGYDVKVVLEGTAVTVARELAKPDVPFGNLWVKLKESGLIDVVCQACSAKLDVTKEVEIQGLPIGGDLNGHPSMSSYFEKGYRVITF